MSNTLLLNLEQVSKSYDKTPVLQDANVQLQRGEMLALLGHNGAGKTTLIKLILGLIPATQGSVQVLQRRPGQHNHQIGYVPENVSFYPLLTGRETLEYFARLNGLKRKTAKAIVSKLLDNVGLTDACDRPVKTYSKGMKQRLGLSQALLPSAIDGKTLLEPSLLILDEPTVGLDPIATLDFFKLLTDLRNHGCGVVICTHVLPGLEQYLDQILILNRGCTVAQGSFASLLETASLPISVTTTGLNGALRSDVALQPFLQPNGQLIFPVKEKVAVLKALTEYHALQDIDIRTPGLPEIYQHFLTQPEGLA